MIKKIETYKVIFLAMTLAFVISMGFAIADESSIIGVLQKTKAGFILTATDGNYLINGGNLAALLGKTIKVTGTITESSEIKTIILMSAEELIQLKQIDRTPPQPAEC